MIAFSGIDCSGKSTQIEKIYKYLTGKKIRCKVIHSRVGYTPLLEAFKRLIRRDKNMTREQQDEYRQAIHSNSKKRKLLLWLSIFDMALYYGIHFRFVELFGKTILADRYFEDSYIDLTLKYGNTGFEKWKVWKFCKKIYLKPKKSIIYVIPAELSMYRSTLKDEPWPEPVEMREVRIAKYNERIELGVWDAVINAEKTIDEVFEETVRYIEGTAAK